MFMADRFLDIVVTPFFETINNDNNKSFLRGQIFWTYYFYTHENLEFWRPKDNDDTKTSATEFVINSSTADAFNRKAPLYTPPLETNEEFIVTRAKRRPVILIAPTPDRITIGGGRINKNLCVVAPLHGVEDAYGNAKFPSGFVDKVRNMEFPHLFFIPKESGIVRNSLCRLESIQSVYKPHLKPTNLRLSDEATNIFLGQVDFFMTGKYAGDYQTYREILMSE